jgi:hypothetical protein
MEDHPGIRTFSTSAVVVAAVCAYFLAPLLAFADAARLATFGCALGVGAGGMWLAVRQGWGAGWGALMTAAGLAGMAGVAWETTHSQYLYAANEARCSHIQREMLLPNPRRADLPDLFTALHCEPRGADDVQFPQRVSAVAASKIVDRVKPRPAIGPSASGTAEQRDGTKK